MSNGIFKELESVITPDRIDNSPDKDIIYLLISAFEELSAKYDKLYEEHLQLRDDYNHLIGEQGRPEAAKKGKRKGGSGNKNHSTEEERSKKEKSDQNNPNKGRGKRNHKIEIHEEKIWYSDKNKLPKDAVFKGFSELIIQDIEIRPRNTKFLLEKYYSPSEGRYLLTDRPQGYGGEFGPGIKALIIECKAICGMSENGIRAFLNNHGIFIAQSTISRKLTEKNEVLDKESEDILKEGIKSSDYLQTDTTGANVNGTQYNTHIFSNHNFTAFRTSPKKDRISIVKHIMEVLEPKYLFNEFAFEHLSNLRTAKKWIKKLRENIYNSCFSEFELENSLVELFGQEGFKTLKKRVTEAGLIAYYRSQKDYPVPKILLTDDAPQYDNITEEHQLCWVHEARHYKKLKPKTAVMRKVHEDFMDRFWAFYREMRAYKDNPSPEWALKIRKDFDELFNSETEYKELNLRIEKTHRNKDFLLTFLDHPHVPLHNNDAELGARAQVRHRDISLFTRNEKGTNVVDRNLTIVKTAKKLDINPFDHIAGLIINGHRQKSLAEIIACKNQKATLDDLKIEGKNSVATKEDLSNVPVGQHRYISSNL
ncbi:IS66 family transposase [Methanoplanus endosymbiosus]|uniref:Transposase n=1 Tax=Methanoplanus endosymbiosus TaxID=33865 RepID=A0A9E7PL83_9EURY|nr:transposase [Methanoplanus endosymbiosus]UUX91528.1 transposase [Methanoplanus endosymbiosus]UUX91675.1 transposase [Methanoplanus endosymbiosus]UUX92207.1 transposase [Methanoplanus endosymbiosus]UUX92224.1 transposase [Methanoplanus endosymbiosus]